MSDQLSWERREIQRLYPQADLSVGVDINQDGVISPLESTRDLREGSDGSVDRSEWHRFVSRNHQSLQRFKNSASSFFLWGNRLRSDNPLHDLLSIESNTHSPLEVRQAYTTFGQILGRVRAKVSANPRMTPLERMGSIATVLTDDLGIRYQRTDDFISGLNIRRLDCDTASFIFIAVGHEMRWPIYGVEVPGHFFVRWDDRRGNRINFDFTSQSLNGTPRSDPDSYYEKGRWFFSPNAITKGIYLTNLDVPQLIAQFLANRGNVQFSSGHINEAVRDYREAIHIHSRNPAFRRSMAVLWNHLGQNRQSIAEYNEIIRYLDPRNPQTFFERGLRRFEMGDICGSIDDFNQVIHLIEAFRQSTSCEDCVVPEPMHNEDYANVYFYRARSHFAMHNYEMALKDSGRAMAAGSSEAELLRLHQEAQRLYFLR